jgi:hypothetical protein
MKTTALSFVLSFMMIFCGVNASNVKHLAGGDPIADYKPGPTAYTVRIDDRNNFTGAGLNYAIVVTNESGSLVAPAQRFRQGELNYTFFEQGPVKGTRIARMILMPLGPGSYYIAPCIMNGTFLPNTCYLFTITPYLKAVPKGKKVD